MSDQSVQLQAHPAHPIDGIDRLEFNASWNGDGLSLRYDLFGDLSRLQIPTGDDGARRDELWRRTCFEAFLRANGADAYVEFNFSPNRDWAAYQFTTYREGRTDLAIANPKIEVASTPVHLSVLVTLTPLPEALQGRELQLGPTAIVQGKDARLSYWALHHPSNKPDFHHSETFQLNLG